MTCAAVDNDVLNEAKSSNLFSFFIPHFGCAVEYPPLANYIAGTGITAIVDFYVTTRFKLYGYRTNADATNDPEPPLGMQMLPVDSVLPATQPVPDDPTGYWPE